MKYDVMIYDSENLADAFDVDSNLIRINGLPSAEAETVADIFMRRGVSVCLLPNEGGVIAWQETSLAL